MPGRHLLEAPDFALHQLKVDVNRIEWIANLVGDTRRQKRQRVNALGFHHLTGLVMGLSDIVQHQGHACLWILFDGGSEHPKESGTRESDLDFASDRLLAVPRSERFPVELWNQPRQRLTQCIFDRVSNQPPGGLIEKDHPIFPVGHDDSVFNGLEQGFQERPLPLETLDKGLESLTVQPVEPGEDFVQKSRFRAAWRIQSHFLFRKYSSVRPVVARVRPITYR